MFYKFVNSLIFAMVAFGASCHLAADTEGIEFPEGSWQSIVATAKSGNKLIFVDVYTEWCGPCIQMAKTVFTQKKVGDFYNKHFVSYKADAENGDGIEVAETYEAHVYPTLLFLNPDSLEVVYRETGAVSADELIALGRQALNPEGTYSSFNKMQKQFSEGERSHEFVQKYFANLRTESISVDEPLEIYIESLTPEKRITSDVFELIHKYARDVQGGPFQLLVDQYDDFVSLAGKDRVDGFISWAYSRTCLSSENVKKPIKDNVGLKLLAESTYVNKHQLSVQVVIDLLSKKQEHQAMLGMAIRYIESGAEYGLGPVDSVPHHLAAIKAEALVEEKRKFADLYLAAGGEAEVIHYLLAEWHFYAGNMDSGRSALADFLSQVKKSEGYNRGPSYWRAAQLYGKTGDSRKAIELAELALTEMHEGLLRRNKALIEKSIQEWSE